MFQLLFHKSQKVQTWTCCKFLGKTFSSSWWLFLFTESWSYFYSTCTHECFCVWLGGSCSVQISCWEGKRSSMAAGRGAHLWLWVCAPEACIVCCDPSALSLRVSVICFQQNLHHRWLFLVLVEVLWIQILFNATLSLQTNLSHRLQPESVDLSVVLGCVFVGT